MAITAVLFSCPLVVRVTLWAQILSSMDGVPISRLRVTLIQEMDGEYDTRCHRYCLMFEMAVISRDVERQNAKRDYSLTVDIMWIGVLTSTHLTVRAQI